MRACATAVEMQQALDQLVPFLTELGLEKLRIGVGVNTGVRW